MGREDVLQVEYEVSGTANITDFTEPRFTQWKLVSGPSYSTEQIITNGKTESKTSYVYLVQPRGSGNFQLPAAMVTADGRRMNSGTATITVKQAAHVPGVSQAAANPMLQMFPEESTLSDEQIDRASVLHNGETPAGKIKGNLFVTVTASKTRCVVGEPILVTYKLYTRLRSQSKVSEQPSFKGCSIYEMTSDDIYSHVETFNGKQYKTYIIRKVQLFPLQAGDISLGTASVDNTVSFSRDGAAPLVEKLTLSNPPMSIHADPLPTAGKPAAFTGAIGKFNISASVAKQVDTAGDNNSLEIQITGAGSFQATECPSINWPTGVQAFEARTKDDINKLDFPASGSKTFTIPFVVSGTGQCIIPPVNFSYFDPEEHLYKTVHTDSIAIQVAPALKNNLDPSKLSGDISNRKYIWIVVVIALLAGISLFWMYRQPKKPVVHRQPEPVPPPVVMSIVPPSFHERLQQLATLEDRRFFLEARQLLSGLDASYPPGDILRLIADCDEVLYAHSDRITKQEMLESMRSLDH